MAFPERFVHVWSILKGLLKASMVGFTLLSRFTTICRTNKTTRRLDVSRRPTDLRGIVETGCWRSSRQRGAHGIARHSPLHAPAARPAFQPPDNCTPPQASFLYFLFPRPLSSPSARFLQIRSDQRLVSRATRLTTLHHSAMLGPSHPGTSNAYLWALRSPGVLHRSLLRLLYHP